MKKLYKIFLLLIVLICLSTYSPNKTEPTLKKNNFFKIKNITIINNSLIDKDVIKKQLSNLYNKNIFLIKNKDIENPLKDIDFLNKIEVKKKYPNSIIIKIFETKPVAILFKSKNKYLIDSSSNLISLKDNFNLNNLPNVFGAGAENSFLDFLKKLEKNSFPHETIESFYYFKIGRWDIELENNKIIKFPYKNTDDIIKKSIDLLNREDFKNYNIIDLRVDGKIIVE